jgi:hypothetical protein
MYSSTLLVPRLTPTVSSAPLTELQPDWLATATILLPNCPWSQHLFSHSSSVISFIANSVRLLTDGLSGVQSKVGTPFPGIQSFFFVFPL